MNANIKATNQKPTHNYIMHILDSSLTFLFIQSKLIIQGDKQPCITSAYQWFKHECYFFNFQVINVQIWNNFKQKTNSRSWLEGKVKKKYKGTLFLFNGIKTASLFKKKKKTTALGDKTSLRAFTSIILIFYLF